MTRIKHVLVRVSKGNENLPLCAVSFLFVDEEYGDSKPKKVRTAPREPKRSKNSQDDR